MRILSKPWMAATVFVLALLTASVFMACEEGSDGTDLIVKDSSIFTEEPQIDAGRQIEVERIVEVPVEVPAFTEAQTETILSVDAIEDDDSFEAEIGQNYQVSLQQQARKIVRNADLKIEAENPPAVQSRIAQIATSLGGWVVNSSSTSINLIDITIRVPADTLDQVLDQIVDLADEVSSSFITSSDFTEEFIDLTARLSSLEQTINALEELLEQKARTSEVDDLLEIHQELTQLQSDHESVQGRLRFIDQSVTFSRVTVSIARSPIDMTVEVDDEIRLGVGRGKQFTARFTPPDGFDQFMIKWDFGDGSESRTLLSALPIVGSPGKFLTPPVVHAYHDEMLSPYAVSVTVTAMSETGIATGKGRLTALVSEVPELRPDLTIDRFDDVQEGDTVSFTATFNDHVDVENLQYEWDFDDGSARLRGTVPDGSNRVNVEHVFDRARDSSYRVRFEIKGDSDAGEVSETNETYIFVYPAPGVEPSSFTPSEVATNGINLMIEIVSVIGNAAIWIGVTLPIWIVVAIVIYLLWRLLNRPPVTRTTQPAATDKSENDEPEQSN